MDNLDTAARFVQFEDAIKAIVPARDRSRIMHAARAILAPAQPEQSSHAPAGEAQACAHDFVRTDTVCIECGERVINSEPEPEAAGEAQLTDMELIALKKSALAATPGPWEWINPENDKPRQSGEWRASLRTVAKFSTYSVGPLPKFIVEADEICDENREANASYIEFANPAAILALIDRVERASTAPAGAGKLTDEHWDALNRAIGDAKINGRLGDMQLIAEVLAARTAGDES